MNYINSVDEDLVRSILQDNEMMSFIKKNFLLHGPKEDPIILTNGRVRLPEVLKGEQHWFMYVHDLFVGNESDIEKCKITPRGYSRFVKYSKDDRKYIFDRLQSYNVTAYIGKGLKLKDFLGYVGFLDVLKISTYEFADCSPEESKLYEKLLEAVDNKVKIYE